MKGISKTKRVTARIVLTVISILLLLLTVTASAAPDQAFLSEPDDKQILPFYDVYIEWYDSADEHHYLMSVRDITNSDTGPMLYNGEYLSQNTTHFTIPRSRLTRGGIYRWSLCAVDENGNRKFSPARTFKMEYGLAGGEDSHLYRTGYASASNIDYSLFLVNPGYESIAENAVNKWNGISSNVSLYRTSNNNSNAKLRIYESGETNNPSVLGRTFLGGRSIDGIDLYAPRVVDYTEIILYTSNMNPWLDREAILEKTILHEVGHALSLGNTNGVDEGSSPNAPAGNCIGKTYDLMNTLSNSDKKNPQLDNVYLIMNDGPKMSSVITSVDKAHLKIKWGD